MEERLITITTGLEYLDELMQFTGNNEPCEVQNKKDILCIFQEQQDTLKLCTKQNSCLNFTIPKMTFDKLPEEEYLENMGRYIGYHDEEYDRISQARITTPSPIYGICQCNKWVFRVEHIS